MILTTIADVTFDNFFIGAEYVYKEEDAIVLDRFPLEDKLNDGRALLINTGYATKGLGINGTFRAMENMGFYAERESSGNAFLLNTINYVPGYTKQQDYAVANIYVYAPQWLAIVGENKAGEIGGQIDLYYTAKKKSLLGGKHGTKFELNYANWSGLDAQHLWADADRGNWAAATLEYSFSPFLSLYVTDLYNYDKTDRHYYSVGGSYTRGRSRVALNFGRQRGGLICVGGVCRFVPENTGLTLNLSTNF